MKSLQKAPQEETKSMLVPQKIGVKNQSQLEQDQHQIKSYIYDCLNKQSISLQNVDFIKIQQVLNEIKKDQRKVEQAQRVHEIDLTSCGLQNLTDFEFFRKLRVFKAHRNNIQVFNLELKYLEELDLSNNMVKQLPNLSLLPHIKHLRLNNNMITQLDFEIDSRDPKISSKNFSRLLTIELTGNLLQIESSDTYNQLIGVLTHFKNLEVLMIDHQKRQETAYVSQKLEKSNKKESSDKHEKLQEAYDQIRKALPLSVLQFNEPYEIPTFAKLFRRIEQANSMPNQVLQFIKELEVDVGLLSKASRQVLRTQFMQSAHLGGVKKVETHQIDRFMQNVLLLVDSQPKLHKIILSILCKLATVNIEESDFSSHCFATLNDLICASKEMKKTVLETLENEVISKLNSMTAETISISLMDGLCKLVRESEKAEHVQMLTKLFHNGFFAKFLQEIEVKQMSGGKLSEESQDQSRFYDSVLLLLQSALTNEKNVSLSHEEKIDERLAAIANGIKQGKHLNRYKLVIRSIDAMVSCPKNGKEMANYFSKGAEEEKEDRCGISSLKNRVNQTLDDYKKSKALLMSDTGKKEHSQGQESEKKNWQLKKETIACEIHLLGSLCISQEFLFSLIHDDEIMDVITLATELQIDPAILSAVSYFSLQVLIRTRELINDNIPSSIKNSSKVDTSVDNSFYMRKVKHESNQDRTNQHGMRNFDDSSIEIQKDFFGDRSIRKMTADPDKTKGSGQTSAMQRQKQETVLTAQNDPSMKNATTKTGITSKNQPDQIQEKEQLEEDLRFLFRFLTSVIVQKLKYCSTLIELLDESFLSGDAKRCNEEVLHELLTNIIKLINYFSVESHRLQQVKYAPGAEEKSSVITAEEKRLMKTFNTTCSKLNDKNREDRLFLVMNRIKSDKVRAQVMEALNNVDLQELSFEEIETLINNLKVLNISAGNIEIILSSIYWILTKLIKDNKALSAEEFRKRRCKETVIESLSILKRNALRQLDDEEEEYEKTMLSISILNFLHAVNEKIVPLEDWKQKTPVLKEILCLEQNNVRKFKDVPIDLEFTLLGSSVSSLWNVISGNEAIKPFTYIGFRVITRLADIVARKRSNMNFDPFSKSFTMDEIKDQLLKAYRERMTMLVESEKKVFEISNPNEEFNDYWRNQLELFVTTNAPSILSNYLIETASDYKIDKELEDAIENAGKKLKAVSKSVRKGQREEEKKQRDNAKYIIVQQAMSQPLAVPVQTSRSTVSHIEAKLMKQEKSSEEYREKEEMRSVTISAFLRALYFSYHFSQASEDEQASDLQLKALENLKDLHLIKQIARLCASTGWFKANLGQKCLQVLAYALDLPTYAYANETGASEKEKKQNRKARSVDRTIYELTSKVVGNILREFRARMGNNYEFKEDDIKLLFAIEEVCFALMIESRRIAYAERIKEGQGKKVYEAFLAILLPVDVIVDLFEVCVKLAEYQRKLLDSLHKKKLAEVQMIQRDYNSLRPSFAQFIGELLSLYDQDNRYAFIQKIMHSIVEEKPPSVRKSLLQEVVEIQNERLYLEVALKYIERQRVIELDDTDENDEDLPLTVELSWIADVKYEPVRNGPTKEQSHWHRRFVLVTKDLKLMIFKEQNESEKCTVDAACKLYSAPKQPLELKVDPNEAKKIAWSSDSEVGLEFKLTSEQFKQPQWEFYDTDGETRLRQMLVQLRFVRPGFYFKEQYCDKIAVLLKDPHQEPEKLNSINHAQRVQKQIRAEKMNYWYAVDVNKEKAEQREVARLRQGIAFTGLCLVALALVDKDPRLVIANLPCNKQSSRNFIRKQASKKEQSDSESLSVQIYSLHNPSNDFTFLNSIRVASSNPAQVVLNGVEKRLEFMSEEFCLDFYVQVVENKYALFN